MSRPHDRVWRAHLRRILRGYAAYDNVLRTHRSLSKDAPPHRAIERLGAVSHDLSWAAFTINIAESNFGTHRVVGRTREVGSGSAGFNQRDVDTELRDFRNGPFNADKVFGTHSGRSSAQDRALLF
jgi:hypothetical protein